MKLFRVCSLPPAMALAVFLVLAGGPLAAQDAPAGKLWSGELLQKDGDVSIDALEDLSAAKIAKVAADIELLWETERDYTGCLERANMLWLAVNDVRFTGDRADFYVRVAQVRSHFLESAGRLPEARAALDQMLVDDSTPLLHEWSPRLVAATPEAIAAAARARGDVRLEAARQRLDTRLGRNRKGARQDGGGGAAVDSGPGQLAESLAADRLDFLERAFGLPGVSMDREVQRMLDSRNDKGVLSLGLRAAPSLALRVLLTLDDPATVEFVDPLALLLEIDPEGAVALMDAFLEQAPDSWQFQVLELLLGRMDHNLINGLWRQGEGWPRPPSRLASLTAKLLRSERMRSRTLPLLRNLAEANALGEELLHAVSESILGMEEDQASELAKLLTRDGWPFPGTQPLWGRVLAEDPRPALRRHAAQMLALSADASGLEAVAADPDVEVRRQVAKLLTERNFASWSWTRTAPRRDGSSLPPNRDDGYFRILELYLADEDPDIRITALNSLLEVEPASWKLEWFELILERARSNAGIARLFLRRELDPARRRAALLGLAESRDPEVLEVLDTYLEGSWDWLRDAEMGTLLLKWRVEDPEHPPQFSLDRQYWPGWLVGKVCVTPVGTAFALRAAGAAHDPLLFERIVNNTKDEQRKDNLFQQALQLLAPEELFALADVAGRPWDVTAAIASQRPDVAEWIAELARPSASRSLLQRTLACGVAARLGHPDAEALCLALLRDPAWRTTEQNSYRVRQFVRFRFEDASRQLAFLRAVLADDSIAEEPKLESLAEYSTVSGEDAIAFAEEVLSRLLEGHLRSKAVRAAIIRLCEAPPTPRRREQLSRAAVVGSLTAVKALAVSRDPELVPVFAEVLKSRAMESGTERRRIQAAAVEALTGIGTAEAAVALAEGLLHADNRDVREDIEAALGALRLYREEIDFWNQRELQVAPTRESALQELLGMLRDEEAAVRAEAARSIAAFEALEGAPALIRLLKDEDESVRAAARGALDRLQGGPPKPAPILF